MISTSEIQMGGHSSRSRSIPMGYALWEFTGENWVLRKDASLPGAVPGEPPRIVGLFPGQIRSQPSVPVVATASTQV